MRDVKDFVARGWWFDSSAPHFPKLGLSNTPRQRTLVNTKLTWISRSSELQKHRQSFNVFAWFHCNLFKECFSVPFFTASSLFSVENLFATEPIVEKQFCSSSTCLQTFIVLPFAVKPSPKSSIGLVVEDHFEENGKLHTCQEMCFCDLGQRHIESLMLSPCKMQAWAHVNSILSLHFVHGLIVCMILIMMAHKGGSGIWMVSNPATPHHSGPEPNTSACDALAMLGHVTAPKWIGQPIPFIAMCIALQNILNHADGNQSTNRNVFHQFCSDEGNPQPWATESVELVKIHTELPIFFHCNSCFFSHQFFVSHCKTRKNVVSDENFWWEDAMGWHCNDVAVHCNVIAFQIKHCNVCCKIWVLQLNKVVVGSGCAMFGTVIGGGGDEMDIRRLHEVGDMGNPNSSCNLSLSTTDNRLDRQFIYERVDSDNDGWF